MLKRNSNPTLLIALLVATLLIGMNTIVLQGVGATLQVGQTVTADFDFVD